ncbi:type II toxin-antitoxin system VapB family antitoxin [Dyadobacter sp. NIV53]|uniref:type II toxin-antitoxin system VapB family antitoxin n=1 Tax=Dyadobacter sp. NIV53 TaxID=2861765 RepID=UPI001C8757B5|nr:type II toxin-antitoxin system VapB family antitoxin [Dyadobacter sp. NIV53]
MKVQVEIDQKKIEKIRRFNKNLRTKREIVDLALTELINSINRQKSMELSGIVEWEGDLNEMRTNTLR